MLKGKDTDESLHAKILPLIAASKSDVIEDMKNEKKRTMKAYNTNRLYVHLPFNSQLNENSIKRKKKSCIRYVANVT